MKSKYVSAMTKSWVAVSSLVLIVATVFGEAAVADYGIGFSKEYTIYLNHAEGTIGKLEIEGEGIGIGRDKTRDLADEEMPILVTLPSRSTVDIKIKNPNRVLFVYREGEKTEEDTDNAKALKDFIVKVGKKTEPNGLHLFMRADEPACLGEASERKKRINGFDFVKFQSCLFYVLSQAEDVKKSVDLGSKSDFAGSKKLITEDVKKAVDYLTTTKPDFNKLLIAITGGEVEYTNDTGEIKKKMAWHELLALDEDVKRFDVYIKQLSTTVNYAIETVSDLLQAIEKSGVDYTVSTGRVNPAKKITQKIIIEENKKFDLFISEDAKKTRAARVGKGTYAVAYQPRDSFLVSIAPGVLYSFVRNPKYSASLSGTTLTIAKTQNDYNELSGIVALNIAFRRWADELFQPILQTGVLPDKDKLAIVLGGGFKAFSKFSFTLGAVYQKTQELNSGLSVGQQISSSDDIKTETRFKSGLYLGISYDME